MEFYVWTCIGIVVGVVHLMIPGQHRVAAASGIALGVGGAWGGALFASAFVRGGWAIFGPLAIAGAIVGAVGAVVSLELIADRYARDADHDGLREPVEERVHRDGGARRRGH